MSPGDDPAVGVGDRPAVVAVGGRPAVVAVGGGHGQAATLRAARRYAGQLTAVVTVADDGGSSGRLRRQLGIVPPGDLRRCLAALAAEGSSLATAFEHRFGVDLLDPAEALIGADPASRRDPTQPPVGHALGNLVLAGLVAVLGDVQAALDEAGRLLGAVGRVVPAAAEPLELKADAAAGVVHGQSAVRRTGHIRRVSLVPDDPPAPTAALAALARADQVLLGPGSLYTSVLAAAVVPAVTDAIGRSPGTVVYVANLRPETAETEGYDVADHVAALLDHGVRVDVVLADPSTIAVGPVPVPVVCWDLARPNGLAHDPGRLAAALAGLVG